MQLHRGLLQMLSGIAGFVRRLCQKVCRREYIRALRRHLLCRYTLTGCRRCRCGMCGIFSACGHSFRPGRCHCRCLRCLFHRGIRRSLLPRGFLCCCTAPWVLLLLCFCSVPRIFLLLCCRTAPRISLFLCYCAAPWVFRLRCCIPRCFRRCGIPGCSLRCPAFRSPCGYVLQSLRRHGRKGFVRECRRRQILCRRISAVRREWHNLFFQYLRHLQIILRIQLTDLIGMFEGILPRQHPGVNGNPFHLAVHPPQCLFLSALFTLFPLDSHAFLMALISAARGFVDFFPALLHSAERRALCN